MNNKTKVILSVIFQAVLGVAINYMIVCCLVKLITLCFGWTFTFPIATGVFFITVLIRYILPKQGKG